MAAGDISRDAGSPVRQGNQWLLTGTIEVDNTERVFALGGTGIQLVDVVLQDTDGVGTAWKRINENVAGTTVNGSISVRGNHMSVDTYRFMAYYV